MRILVVICLLFFLHGCSALSPKDYSGAKKLEPVEGQLTIKPLWIEPTGDVPEDAHAQLPPVVSEGVIYIANISGKVSSLNASNGRKIWTRSIGGKISGGPGVGAGMVFIGTRGAEIVSLAQRDGSEQWRIKVSSEMLSTPVFSNNSLFIQTIDGKITSIDTKTGNLNWVYSHDTPKLTLRGTASPLAIGNAIICGFADGKLVSVNAGTGELNWSTTVSTPKGRTDLERLADIDGVFRASDDTVYVISYQGRVAAVSIENGAIQWSRKMSSYSGLAINEDQVFLSDVDGNVWALAARTGATLWKQDGLTGREITTPEVIGKAVVLADFEGYVHWLSKEDGQFIARQSLTDLWEDTFPTVYDTLDEEIQSMNYHRLVTVKPLVIGNRLYLRDNFGALAALQLKE